MALHDDIDRESRFDPEPEHFGHGPNGRADNFRRELISAWLVAALLAIGLLLLQPSSDAPPSHAICRFLAEAPLPSSTDQPPKSAEAYECSDLDYAYERC